MLEQDRHEIRNQDDGQQRVAKLRAAREIGRPVARVHVADRDEKAGAGEGEQLAPEGRVRRHDNAAVNFRERNHAAAPPPAAGWSTVSSVVSGIKINVGNSTSRSRRLKM